MVSREQKLLEYVRASKQQAAVAGHQGHSDTDDHYHMGRAVAYQDIEHLLMRVLEREDLCGG